MQHQKCGNQQYNFAKNAIAIFNTVTEKQTPRQALTELAAKVRLIIAKDRERWGKM